MSRARFENELLSVQWAALHRQGKALPVLRALKAWRAGEASPEQQKLAFSAIEHVFGGIDAGTYAPADLGGQKVQDMLEGRRGLVLQLRRAVNTPDEDLIGERPNADPRPAEKPARLRARR